MMIALSNITFKVAVQSVLRIGCAYNKNLTAVTVDFGSLFKARLPSLFEYS